MNCDSPWRSNLVNFSCKTLVFTTCNSIEADRRHFKVINTKSSYNLSLSITINMQIRDKVRTSLWGRWHHKLHGLKLMTISVPDMVANAIGYNTVDDKVILATPWCWRFEVGEIMYILVTFWTQQLRKTRCYLFLPMQVELEHIYCFILTCLIENENFLCFLNPIFIWK